MTIVFSYALFGVNTAKYHRPLCKAWRDLKGKPIAKRVRGIVYHDADLSPLWQRKCAEAGLETRNVTALGLKGLERPLWRNLAVEESNIVIVEDADTPCVGKYTAATLDRIEKVAEEGKAMVFSHKPNWGYPGWIDDDGTYHTDRCTAADAQSLFLNCGNVFPDMAVEIATYDDPRRHENVGEPLGADYGTDERWLEERMVPRVLFKHVNVQGGDLTILEATEEEAIARRDDIQAHPRRVRVLLKGTGNAAKVRSRLNGTFAEVVKWTKREHQRHLRCPRLIKV